jgi:NAD(P)-dependent dehydrogenase (short-subunit alcohol dehydrogenase family)
MSVVLITGCSSGLGKLAALEFARRGDRAYASMRDLGKSQPLVSAARAEDLDIETIQLDVTQSPSIDAAVERILDQEGRIDVLVNNAGMFAVGPIEYFSDPRP